MQRRKGKVAKEGGGISKRARLDLKKRSGKKIMTKDNYLKLTKSKNRELKNK